MISKQNEEIRRVENEPMTRVLVDIPIDLLTIEQFLKKNDGYIKSSKIHVDHDARKTKDIAVQVKHSDKLKPLGPGASPARLFMRMWFKSS